MSRLSGPPLPISKPRVLLTGGPTRAYLDRVRFLSNVSTGALAYELCRELKRRKIEVGAVIGPSSLPFEELGLKTLVRVETNEEMLGAMLKACRTFRPTHAVFSAAVLDFIPLRRVEGKVSSKTGEWTIRLKASPKIIDEVRRKFPAIKRVGFKLEWKSAGRKKALEYGRRILERKGLEGLCLNYLSELSGRGHPALLLAADGGTRTVATKKAIARWIADLIAST